MGLEALIVVPSEPVSTDAARAALPASVPLGDAVFNVAEAATLILGLAGANWDLIAAGLHDRLHQPHRAHLYPRSVELLERVPAARCAGRDDLRRRAERARVVPIRADRRRQGRARARDGGLGTGDPRAVRVSGRGRPRAVVELAGQYAQPTLRGAGTRRGGSLLELRAQPLGVVLLELAAEAA